MSKKPAQSEPFVLPKEVKNLPAEIPVPSTRAAYNRLKRKDESRRDKALAEFDSAARQSPEEERFAHASRSAIEYEREIDRLNRKLTAKRLPKGQRPALKQALKTTTANLADCLFELGQYAKAYDLLEGIDKQKRAYILEVIEAIYRPDDEHCDCSPLEKCVERKCWVPECQKFVDLIKCACGHRNCSEEPPANFAALQRARAEAVQPTATEPGDRDEVVMARAERVNTR